MRRLLLLLAVLLLAAALALAVRPWSRPPGPVYTVAQVAASLAHHRRLWGGRTVTVRGVAIVVEEQVSAGGGVIRVCTDAPCAPSVQPLAALHVILVDSMPKQRTAAAQLGVALVDARERLPVMARVPPSLVVLSQPDRGANGIIHWLQSALAHLPYPPAVVQAFPTVSGGTPRLYRMRLLPAPSPTVPVAGVSRTMCEPVCDDGVLLARPY